MQRKKKPHYTEWRKENAIIVIIPGCFDVGKSEFCIRSRSNTAVILTQRKNESHCCTERNENLQKPYRTNSRHRAVSSNGRYIQPIKYSEFKTRSVRSTAVARPTGGRERDGSYSVTKRGKKKKEIIEKIGWRSKSPRRPRHRHRRRPGRRNRRDGAAQREANRHC